MPTRPFRRDQDWLLPPSLTDLIPADHPARFVAAFVDALDASDWAGLGVAVASPNDGAPRYDPRGLLSVWLYGFLTGVRTTRMLERACHESLPFLWLSGLAQPDHNTLWRFYQTHRQALRTLLKRTVRTAVSAGLVDLALQAIDGTKIAGNAAKDRTRDAASLARLEQRLDERIAALEARNAAGDQPEPPRLPPELAEARGLRQTVRAALARVRAAEGPTRTNLTDPDAPLMKGRAGFVAGYNGQATVVATARSAQTGTTGRLITATTVTDDPDDHASLIALLAAAEENQGCRSAQTVADAGYHSGENLAACAAREQIVLMPESHTDQVTQPYHKAQFVYDAATDTFTCPEGQLLPFRSETQRQGGVRKRVYGAGRRVCHACPAFGVCTTNRQGRRLETLPTERALAAHRERMQMAAARAIYRKRKELVELTFGLLKDRHGGRRFWLRGLESVRAEWDGLAIGFNLKTLARFWAERTGRARRALVQPLAA